MVSVFFFANASVFWARQGEIRASSLSTTHVIDRQSGETVGKSTLFRNGETLEFILKARGLEPGDTFSVWLILTGEDSEDGTMILNAGQGLVDVNGNGCFAGHLEPGVYEPSHPDPSNPGEHIIQNGGVLVDPLEFDVKLAIVPHGPSVGQKHQPDGCGQETINLLACADVWESMHSR